MDDFFDESYLLAVAIDFGTTFTGYAYSFKNDPYNISMNKNWSSEVGAESYKAPTCVMTNPDGSFNSFGYKAEHEYNQLDSTEVKIGCSNGYNLYRHFKMMLHKKGVHLTSNVVSVSGHIRKAIDIFSMTLKYLYQHLTEALRKALQCPPRTSDIRWVLTVPAIWTDESKAFMREAAFKAGLILSKNSKKLLIALEPEAASIYCRSLDMSPFQTEEKAKESHASFKTGQKLLVVDAGGGTVDVTGHKILIDGKVKEVSPPSGGPWGGTNVDAKFQALLSKVFGSEFLDSFKKKHPQEWLVLCTGFERAKKLYVADGAHSIKVTLPYSFHEELQEAKLGRIKELLEKFGDPNLTFGNGYLVIKYERANSLFSDTISQITDHVRSLSSDRQLAGVGYILLVGGFGECKVLQEAFQQASGNLAKVLTPEGAQLAIIKGALLYGHNPMQITSRIARFTYGDKITEPFDDNKHDSERKRIIENKEYCDVFEVFVKRGEQVNSGDVKCFHCRPLKMGQNVIDFVFYRTELENPMYVDEPSVTEIARGRLESKDGPLSDNIETRVTFGHTEILVESRDKDKEDHFSMSTLLEFM